mgnify:CR=1 FL=1
MWVVISFITTRLSTECDLPIRSSSQNYQICCPAAFPQTVVQGNINLFSWWWAKCEKWYALFVWLCCQRTLKLRHLIYEFTQKCYLKLLLKLRTPARRSLIMPLITGSNAIIIITVHFWVVIMDTLNWPFPNSCGFIDKLVTALHRYQRRQVRIPLIICRYITI